MTTAWRIPLSAHVCTPADAPAAARASVYLASAAEEHDKAQLLLGKHRTLKNSDYRDALWCGYWELKRLAESHMQQVMQCGALLHYCSPKAIALADEISELNLQQTLKLLKVATC